MIRILMIGPATARVLVQRLLPHVAWVEAESVAAGASLVLAEPQPHIVLLDVGPGDASALASIGSKNASEPRVPMVMLVDNESDGPTALAAGADDYIVKGTLDTERLERILRVTIGRRAIREQRDTAPSPSWRDQRLLLALEASRTGIWTWQVESDVVSWSPQCYEILGLSSSQFSGTGAAFFALVHPDDRERVAATVNDAIERRARYWCELRIMRPDGSALWVQNLGRATYEKNNTQVIGTITNIDERMASQAAVQTSEKRLRLAQEEAKLGTWDWDVVRDEFYWTDSASRLFGRGPASGKIDHSVWLDSIHTDDRARAEREMNEALAAGQRYGSEFRVPQSDGAPRWLQSIGEVERDASGRAIRVLGTVRDVTEQRRAQELVAEALAKAEHAAASRDHIFSMVAHDLRTPLGTIILATTALERMVVDGPVDPARVARLCSTIQRQRIRMENMLNELVDDAALQAGQSLALVREPCDFVTMLRNIVADRPERERQRLRTSFAEDSMIGIWDFARAERVVQNLVGNALKYSPSDAEVYIDVAADERDVRLVVRDRGIGIPPSELDSVFDWFRRGSNTHQGAIEGAGIGLASCKHIVEQHGGRIGVESRLGVGSTFTVVLPRR